MAPDATVIHLTHGIARHDVRAGSLALWRVAPHLAPAVAVAVVDPGVGTGRRAVAVEVAAADGDLVLVGPDNGLLVPAAHRAGALRRAVVLDDDRWHLRQEGAGATFAGRDIFAPVAGHLAAGVDLSLLGSPLDPSSLVGGPLRTAVPDATGRIDATVLWIDHFGNVQLDVAAVDLPSGTATVRLRTASSAPAEVAVVSSYAALGPRPGLVPDSAGLLSLCVDRAHAGSTLGMVAGAKVVLETARTDLAGILGG